MIKKQYIILPFFFIVSVTFAQSDDLTKSGLIDSTASSWADSVLKTLSLDEKIAQLMMIRTYSNKDETYYLGVEHTILKYKIGGLCFFQGGPVRQANLTNRYQEFSKIPLLIAMDAEWGPGMRLDSTYSFPYQMTLGAMNDDHLIYEMGAAIAGQLKLLGVHINFAPVADINNNPVNPVINSRSFGESRFEVTKKSLAYMKGLQDNGIIATAKHFPGHGDTDTDSHYALPVISHSRERLDSVELYPFSHLIDNGLDAVMIAHLLVTSLDSTKNTPATLSKAIVTDLLKNELGFQGLVITDALDMKGVTANHSPGEIELKAFLAGNDILLLPQNVEAAINEIKNAVGLGNIPEEMVNERCLKILKYKQKAGLDNYSPVMTDSLFERLNIVNNELLTRKIFESAITVVKNENNLIPLIRPDTLKIASLSIGSPEINKFQEMLGNYCPVDHYNILSSFTEKEASGLIEKLKNYNLIIIGIHNSNIFASKNFGLSLASFNLIDRIAEQTKVILTVFANPYSINSILHPDSLASIIVAYQDNNISNEIAAQIIMGSIAAIGKLPVYSSPDFPSGFGLKINSVGKLKYVLPEEVGIAGHDFDRIDSIALMAIREKATPGCQIVVAKDGKVIYRKSFGYHTYEKADIVKNTDLYDLASLTKIEATTLAVMKLVDGQKFDIDFKLGWYLPWLKGTNKENIIVRELMAHQAQLTAWIAFYIPTVNRKRPNSTFYSDTVDKDHNVKVADNLYMRDDYKKTIFDSIASSRLLKKKEYVYSDLGFILLRQCIENVANEPLDKFTESTFYKPLGLQTICFNPLDRFDLARIVPTEKDDYFRNQLIHGYVHDPGAAMLGGVSGHAGLFSNAGDVAVIMQMLLQGGEYGGIRYFNQTIVEEFTKQQFPMEGNRRAIGFDKPDLENRDNGPTCESASELSFGHTGFTGTYAWADPKYNLVYIFLSNRIYPTAKNDKLIKMKVRKEIQKVVYEAVLNSIPETVSENR
jgi:beta-glucosidase-like glycosyl hydrolase/CubicO group peptidase (beta-lactamase class C family)